MDKQSKKGDNPQTKPQEMKVAASPEISKGVYSNVAAIRHTPNEFVIDFILQFDASAQLVSRIILSPSHMQALKKAIEENIRLFEAKRMTKH